jgi:hypothetical protein
MKGVTVRAAQALILLAVAVCPARAEKVAVGSSPIDPNQYPGISDKEMGQLRWVLNIANQPLDEFRGLEGRNQDDLTSYRYAIAFGAYFLALEQYHKLPAWSEAIQPAFDRLIQRMTRKPVWEYWAQTSRGVPQLEPGRDRPYPEARDPVAHWNIMYSGHVAHMVNLYEMLYRDFKWDAAGSIVFAWSDTERCVYGNQSLVKALHDQMSGNPYHAISCEPNAVFPECNQHPVLSFILYDHTHGTRLSEVKSLFMDFFLRKRMVDPDTHHTALLYLVKQDRTVSQVENPFGNALAPRPPSPDSPTANGWTGTFMHAWRPDDIERLYPFWKRAAVIEKDDDTAELREESWEPLVRYGFFAMLAGEMGDTSTRDKLLNHADKEFAPVWQDRTFHYPYNPSGGCTNLSDKLFAFARANPPNGLWTMHNKPFDESHFAEPRLSGVDFPNVLVRRAIYDAQEKALVVSVEPGARKAGTTRFEVRQLDPSRSYVSLVDGKKIGTHKGQATVVLEVGLDEPHDLVLVAEGVPGN